jgi:sugar O-acyltransferase (sialic acid O-acetyltransferase NeuD family)
MTKSLVILGASGNAHDVLDILDAMQSTSRLRFAGWLDDRRSKGEMYLGFPILGIIADAMQLQDEHAFINAIGSDRSYSRRPEVVLASGLATECFATLVHPRASVSQRAELGAGTYVSFGASIAGAATLGDHVAVCPGCIVGHDSQIENYTILAPGAVLSGSVVIEANAYIGARAVLRQGVRIGRGALVGMGAVVTRDVPTGAVVAGCPARVMARVAR